MPPRFPQNNEGEDKIARLKRAMYSRVVANKLVPRDRRVMDALPTTVATDFEKPVEAIGGKVVAPRTINAVRYTLWWVLGAAMLFFLVAVGIFVYYFFFGEGSAVAAPGNVDISIRGPVNVSGGEPAEFQIIVANRNQTPLELADLIVTYPPGTRSPTDLATDLPSQRIALGTIEPGGRRQGTVTAIMVGTEGAHIPVHAEVEYRVLNSSAIFVAKSDYTVTFSASPISIAIEANGEAISGQPMILDATISSNGAAPVKDVLLSVGYPFGYTVQTTNPESASRGFWELGDIKPGETRKIQIRGILTGEAADERVFSFSVGTRRNRSAQIIEVPMSATSHRVAIAKPFIGLTVDVNKQNTGGAAVFAPGDLVNVAVNYVNNLSSAIDDAILVVSMKGLTIDGTSVHTTDGFYRSSDRTVLWDKDTTNGALTHLDPGERGTVHFSFQLPDAKKLANMTDPSFNVVVHAAGKRVDQKGVPETLQAVASTTVKLASSVQFLAQGFYHQNPFGSTGPLPPKVNEETTYAIVWAINNSSNAIKNGKVTATLPSYVRWIGVYSPASEKISFNVADGTITWNVGDVPAGTGVEGALPRRVAFAVGITPSESQTGQDPALIRFEKFTATDEFAGVAITRTAPDVTTNIVNDQGFSTTEASVTP